MKFNLIGLLTLLGVALGKDDSQQIIKRRLQKEEASFQHLINSNRQEEVPQIKRSGNRVERVLQGDDQYLHMRKLINPGNSASAKQFGFNKGQYKKCLKNGGYYQRAGKIGLYICITPYIDGGKACTTSQQCDGDCIITSADSQPTCQYNNNPFGCWVTVEQYEENQAIICRD